VARGEAMARALGVANDTEDEKWRAVVIRAWDKTQPPKLDGPVTPGGIPRFVPGVIDNLGWVDVIGGVVSIVDLGIDIAGTLFAAGIVTSVAGLVISGFSAIIAMPALWASTDKLAEFNGRVQGYADAMQDMADQYSDPALDKKPVKQWPPIQRPQPHISGNLPINVSESFWRQGQRKGCDAAYTDILKFEANPIEVNATVKGKPARIKLNGKLYLRGLAAAKKDKVGVMIVELVNAELKKQGKAPFPTR
jgi:hypothetical protein